jgi:sugar phosphate isomerase/epimerase
MSSKEPAMPFQRTELLCFACLPDGYSYAERFAAAARAGFRELSLWLMSIDEARQELGSLEAVKAVLDENGLRATSLELLFRWPDARSGEHMRELEEMQAAAAVFQPELVMVGCMGEMADEQLACNNLREQCRAVAGEPWKLALEFLPWSALPDIASVRRVVDTVAEDNLGFVLDTWHFARAGLDYAALAELPGERIHFIQVADALAQAREDMMEDTLGYRVPPGEGVVDWPRLMSILEASGVDCPIGTEMFSNAVKAMPLDQASEHLYEALQRPFR